MNAVVFSLEWKLWKEDQVAPAAEESCCLHQSSFLLYMGTPHLSTNVYSLFKRPPYVHNFT